MPTLLSVIDGQGPAIYYSDRFRQMVEDHLPIMFGSKLFSVQQITESDWATLNRYVGDFYGFLKAMGKDNKYHWTIMRMNGFRDRMDLSLELTQLVLPDTAFIDKLAQLSKEKR